MVSRTYIFIRSYQFFSLLVCSTLIKKWLKILPEPIATASRKKIQGYGEERYERRTGAISGLVTRSGPPRAVSYSQIWRVSMKMKLIIRLKESWRKQNIDEWQTELYTMLGNRKSVTPLKSIIKAMMFVFHRFVDKNNKIMTKTSSKTALYFWGSKKEAMIFSLGRILMEVR